MTTVKIAGILDKSTDTDPITREDFKHFLSWLGTQSNRKIKRLARAYVIENYGAFIRERYDGLVGNLIRWRDGLHNRGR